MLDAIHALYLPEFIICTCIFMYVLTVQCKYICYNYTCKYAVIMCTVCGIGYTALKTVASTESVADGNTETKVRVHDAIRVVHVITVHIWYNYHNFCGFTRR